MTRVRVVLRTDADERIGVGHAMRSITLGAAMVDRGAEVVLVTEALPEALVRRATRRRLLVHVAERSRIVPDLFRLRPSVVVVDGYHLAPLLVVLAGELPYALVDDNHELPIESAALVVNQNLHATPELYPEAHPAQRLLLGSRYALLRRDVLAIDRPAQRRQGTRVLVALGGGDAHGLTGALVGALLDRPDYEVWLGIGPANPRRSELVSLAAREPDRVRVDRGDLVDGYRWADVAVIGSGTTMWEVGYLGLPALAVIVADNQLAGARAAETHGFLDAVDGRAGVDPVELVERCARLASDTRRRRWMSNAGRELFDGRGAERVAEELHVIAGA